MAGNKALISSAFAREGYGATSPASNGFEASDMPAYSAEGWPTSPVDLGRRLKLARVARNLSQAEVARGTGVSRAAISQWEAGDVEATITNLSRAAKLLAVSLPWLICGDPTRLAAAPAAPTDGRIAEMESGIGAGGPWHRAGLEADTWRIPPAVLAQFDVSAEHAKIFRVLSPLMEPTIPRGAHVLVDLSDISAHDGLIHAVDSGVSLVLKRIYLRAGPGNSVMADLVSDAARDRATSLPLKQVKIAGRVVAQLVKPL